MLFGGLGGHGSVVFSLVEGSHRAKSEVDHELLFVGTGDLLEEYRDRCVRGGIRYHFERTRGGLDVRFQRGVLAWLRKTRPDVVVVHSTGAIGGAVVARAMRWTERVVVVEHQSWGLRSPRHDWATRVGLLCANETLVLTQAYIDQLRDRFRFSSRAARITKVENGIDTSVFQPRGRSTKQVSALRIGMQSRLTPIKDHPTLIAALALVRDRLAVNVELWIAGDGINRQRLEDLAVAHGVGDHVVFTGMLDEPELVRFLNSLDVYVHASLGEAMSTALLQAMACELATVASDVPGIADLVRGEGVVELGEDLLADC